MSSYNGDNIGVVTFNQPKENAQAGVNTAQVTEKCNEEFGATLYG